MITIKLKEGEGRGNYATTVAADRHPDRCPFCDKGIKPNWHYSWLAQENLLYVVWECPCSNCHHLFLSYYIGECGDDYRLQTAYRPYAIEVARLPETVETLSPDFCKIYRQARIAEANDLDEVCGPAYRKALEFLIKDFLLKHRFATDLERHEGIKKTHLGPCIQNYVDHEQIKFIARKAKDIGNDETHYERRSGKEGIEELKALVMLTVTWIDMILQTDSLMASSEVAAKADGNP